MYRIRQVKMVKVLLGLIACSALQYGFASDDSGFVVQLGAFTATQGSQQHIGINGLIGDDFSVTDPTAQNVLAGVGYYFDEFDSPKISLLYGLDAFYLAPTKVQGNVAQEGGITNLSYQYSLTNVPLYFAGKAILYSTPKYEVTIDVGVGPNFIITNEFSQTSADPETLPPDQIFSGNTTIALSAMAGFGLRINDVLGQLPLEIDYRCFYLGQSHLNQLTGQTTNALETGDNYANALFLSLSF